MAKITIMVGLPASGKSTKAAELIQHGNTVRLNKDLLRTMLHFDKFTGVNEGLTQNATKHLACYFLTQGINVIIDDTNLNLKTLQGWKDIAKMFNAKTEYHKFLDVPIETCLERDAIREKKVGKHTIVKMALQYLDYLKGERVLICDLDGTLCEITHRLHYVIGEKKDWKSFFEQLIGDTVREEVKKEIVGAYLDGVKIIFVSARPERYRSFTMVWLQSKVGLEEYILLMRPDHNNRKDTEVKAEIYEKYLKHLNIVKVFDDRPSVIRMWRKKGLNVQDVGKGVEF